MTVPATKKWPIAYNGVMGVLLSGYSTCMHVYICWVGLGWGHALAIYVQLAIASNVGGLLQHTCIIIHACSTCVFFIGNSWHSCIYICVHQTWPCIMQDIRAFACLPLHCIGPRYWNGYAFSIQLGNSTENPFLSVYACLHASYRYWQEYSNVCSILAIGHGLQ